MNKEEILKKAQKENNGVDEVKRAVEKEAAKISMEIGVIVCMLLNILDHKLWQTHVIGDTCWIIYGTMVSSRLWIYSKYMQKKRYLIGAILTTASVMLISVFLFLG